MTIYQQELLRQLPKLNCTGQMNGENGMLNISANGIPLCIAGKKDEIYWKQENQITEDRRSVLDSVFTESRSLIPTKDCSSKCRRIPLRKTAKNSTATSSILSPPKYALTELLICGECGTPYRRCTWTAKGEKKIVWRCINRLDYGKKYCHHSPSIEEKTLHEAIMKAIMRTAKQNAEVLKTLKLHIGMGLEAEETEDKSLDIQIRISEIDAEFKKMLNAVSEGNIDNFDEERANELMTEKQRLAQQLEQYANIRNKRESAKSRLDQIFTILDGMQNHPMEYDDQIVRQILECVVVESKEEIKVVFVGGTEVREQINT